jgi:hypothetical protein
LEVHIGSTISRNAVFGLSSQDLCVVVVAATVAVLSFVNIILHDK